MSMKRFDATSTMIEEENGLFATRQCFSMGFSQSAAKDAGIARAQFFTHIDHVNGRQVALTNPLGEFNQL